MARKITIDIKTTANLGAINTLVGGLQRFQREIRSVTTSLNSFNKAVTASNVAIRSGALAVKSYNSAIRPIGNNAVNAAIGIDEFDKSLKSAESAMLRSVATTAMLSTNMKTLAASMKSIAKATSSMSKTMSKGVGAKGSTSSSGGLPMGSMFGITNNAEVDKMISNIMKLNNTAHKLAQTFLGNVRTAFTSAANAARGFVSSASSVFSTLMRSLNSVGQGFMRFANIVKQSMTSSQRSIQQFYSAGWSLLTSGYMMKNFGEGIFKGMGNMLNKFTDYEKALTRTAISGASVSGEGSTLEVTVDPTIIQDLIFGLQRGTIGTAPIQQFDAKELAEGLYYYTSAIGMPVTKDNMSEVGGVVSTIMQMAAVTQTGLETATKGVLNAALEFGIDPRDTNNAKQIEKIAAQMGYLANISTMEVPDIVETFKMLGPMAHILSGKKGGSGLDESFALTFLASEVGLRGGNVGRGLNQALTSLLDPTDKVLSAAADAWGIEASKDAFRAFFFNAEGQLKGGLPGLFEKIGQVDPTKQAQFLATMFTTNATRSLIGIQQSIEKAGGWDNVMKDIAISGENPMRWLSEAQAATNDTIFAQLQNLKNAWFAVSTEIIDAISGPLKRAVSLVADAMWTIADAIKANPWLAKFVTTILMVIAALTTLVGTAFMVSGSILLVFKAFAMIGSLAHPMMLFIFAFMQGLTMFIPIMLAVAAAAVMMHTAWEKNVLGLRTTLTDAFTDFNFDKSIMPLLNNISKGVQLVFMAWVQFVNGILLGIGPLNALYTLMNKVFGSRIADGIMVALAQLSYGLEGVRMGVKSLFADIGQGVSSLSLFSNAVRGFMEQLLFKDMSLTNVMGIGVIGHFLGIDSLPMLIMTAADAFRAFIADVVFYASSAATNIRQIFSPENLSLGASVFGALISGFGKGIAEAVDVAMKAVVLFTAALANAGKGGTWITDHIKKWLGLEVTITQIAKTIGTTIGVLFGIRLAAAIVPGFAMLLKLGGVIISLLPIIGGFGTAILGAAGQMIGFVVNIGITIASMIAQGAIIAGQITLWILLAAAKLAWHIMSAAATAAATAEAAAHLLLSAGMTVEATAAITAAIAQEVFMVSLLGATAGALALQVGLLPLVAIIYAIVAAIVLLVGTVMFLVAAFSLAFIFVDDFRNGVFDLVGAIGSGLMPVMSALWGTMMLVASGFAWLFGVLGRAFSDLAEHTTAMKIFGYVVGAAFLYLISPILIVGAAIALLAAVFILNIYVIIKTIDLVLDAVNKFVDAIKAVPSVLGAAWDGITETILRSARGIVDAVNSILEPIAELKNTKGVGNLIPFDVSPIDTSYLDDQIKEIENKKYMEKFNKALGQANDTSRFETQGEQNGQAYGDGFWAGIWRGLDKVGLADDVQGAFSAAGLDPNNPNFKSFDWTKFFDTSQYTSLASQNTDFMPREVKKMMEDMQSYDTYLNMVDAKGKKATDAFYLANDQQIPTAPDWGSYFDTQTEAIEDGSEYVAKAIADHIASLSEAMKSADMGTVLKGMFGAGLGDKGTSAAEGIFSIAETVISNIGDAGPWLNVTELLADAAGSGLNLGKDVSGQNIHKALEPYFEKVAQQTGTSITDIMKDIPKYIVPEEYIPMATGELIQGLNNIPTDLYDKIDTLGIGKYTEFGIDWAELASYGIGQGLANKEWNLADYIASSWDMSVADAEKYLMQNGINPNAISNSWFDDTQMLINSMGGQVNVLTDEWYQWLYDNTNGFADKVIHLTQEAFNQLPDAVKIGYTNMGYSFVLGAKTAVSSLDESANMIADHMKNVYTAIDSVSGDPANQTKVDQFWKRLWDDAAANGVIDKQGMLVEDLGNGWTRVTDSVSGVTIEIPSIEMDDFLNSVRSYENAISDLEKLRTRRDAIKADLEAMYSDPSGNMGQGMAYTAGGAATYYVQDQTSELEERLGRIRGKIDELLGITDGSNDMPINVKVEVDTTGSSYEAVGKEIYNGIVSGFTNGQGSGDGSGGAGNVAPFDEIFRGYATSAATAFQSQLQTDLFTMIGTAVIDGTGGAKGGVGKSGGAPFDDAFRGYATSAANVFKSTIESALSGWTPTMTAISAPTQNPYTSAPQATPSGANSVLVSMGIDKTQFDADLASIMSILNTFDTKVYTTELAATNLVLAEVYNGAADSLVYFETHTYTTTLSANSFLFDTVFAAVNMAVTLFNGSTYTATINIQDNASFIVSAVLNALDLLDGKIATSTIRTVNEVVSTATTGKAAVGGVINDALTLVGEEGPEIAALPSGTRVKSTANTMQMLRSAVSSAITPRDATPITASEEFRRARQWQVQGASGSGEIKVEINNLNVSKEVDVDAALERVDRLIGQKLELVRRGMGSFESSRTL